MSLRHRSPASVYDEWLATDKIHPDPIQQMAVEKLDQLHDALEGYTPDKGEDGWKARLLPIMKERRKTPQGLYLYSDPGRGKSMLMDLFFDTLETDHKRRVHFHEFMKEVQAKLHKLRKNNTEEPLEAIAAEIAAKTHVLCFDEFHVTDITDAMILKGLFSALIHAGVVVVATSNWRPKDLYKDGLQRENFVPFIDLILERLDVVELCGDMDYRAATIADQPHYLHPANKENEEKLRQIYLTLTDGDEGDDDVVVVQSRTIRIPKTKAGVAWFSFFELCGRPLGVGDYLIIAKRFHTMLVSQIPRFTDDNRDQAKRFMLLIDVLYEQGTRFACTAEASPDCLCPSGLLAFEFQRTASRLKEMQKWAVSTDGTKASSAQATAEQQAI